MNKKKLYNLTSYFNCISMIFIFSFILLNTIIVFNLISYENKKENVLRLHIIANSNSIEDQIIKLKISDKINNYIKDISKNLNSREDLVKTVYNNKEKLLQISNEELKQNTKNYSSTLKLGKIHYEKKQSINLDMPSGTYQSINITLGEGNGKNIWSLIFPNEKNIESIAGYETILPGISNIFNHNNAINKNNTYDIKILEIFNKLKVGL